MVNYWKTKFSIDLKEKTETDHHTLLWFVSFVVSIFFFFFLSSPWFFAPVCRVCECVCVCTACCCFSKNGGNFFVIRSFNIPTKYKSLTILQENDGWAIFCGKRSFDESLQVWDRQMRETRWNNSFVIHFGICRSHSSSLSTYWAFHRIDQDVSSPMNYAELERLCAMHPAEITVFFPRPLLFPLI